LTIGAGADAGADDITLGLGNLTLNVVGPVTQVSGNVIRSEERRVGKGGSVTLTESRNNVETLAASYNGSISYTDANALLVGTVTDVPSGMAAGGIATTEPDVKLSVLAGGLTIGAGADAGADDITLGLGNLTLNVVGPVTQVSGNVI